MSAIHDAVGGFLDRPRVLPKNLVKALLNELCGDFGYCLPPNDYDALVEDPPTDPQTFAERVMGVQDGWSDPEAFLPILQDVLKTFQGFANRDDESELPIE